MEYKLVIREAKGSDAAFIACLARVTFTETFATFSVMEKT